MSSRPLIRVTEIGEFIRHKSCERRFKLDFNNRVEAKRLPFAERLFNPLDPVLQRVGKEREEDWEDTLQSHGFQDVGQKPDEDKSVPWAIVAARLSRLAPGTNAYAREVQVEGAIGEFDLHGRIDFVLLLWRDGKPLLRLVECKASRRERTYHRIQVACYKLLVEPLLDGKPIQLGEHTIGPHGLECVVARIDEETNQSQDVLAIPAFDLSNECADLQQLLSRDGHLARIVATRLDDLAFRLDSKCDGCVFSVDCLPEAARQRRLELIGITPPTSRELRNAGVRTIDDLAQLDLNGSAAQAIRNAHGFTDNLASLQAQAKARRRTLPGGGQNPDEYEVSLVPNSGVSQLPVHVIGTKPLVRVYLSVDFDYTENRVGAISAHVTSSDWRLRTEWKIPEVLEQPPFGTDAPKDARRPVRGQDIVEIRDHEWTHDQEQDTLEEARMIRRFFDRLILAIQQEANVDAAPIHFYTWTRGDMKNLMDACARADPALLGSLQELLGCRESLEQLIYSSLQDEMSHRYALGWTGRGLSVISGLKWYGERYHWTRLVDGAPEDLDYTFTQDIFDFKTDLKINPNGSWADPDDANAGKHKFEIRSRFHDTLSAPYWHALWGTLPDPNSPDTPASLKAVIKRYNRAGRRNALEAYLAGRCQAMRWLEERVSRKNEEIQKPALALRTLGSFSLGVTNARQASLDFLRLDHHVGMTEWIISGLAPPGTRIPAGETLPVRDVIVLSDGRLSATIDPSPMGLTLSELEKRATYAEGAFARLAPCDVDPQRGQTIRQLLYGGATVIIDTIDWTTGGLILDVLSQRQGRYWPYSKFFKPGETAFAAATVDSSPADYVSNRVDKRLDRTPQAPAYSWLDPIKPTIPPLTIVSPETARDLDLLARSFQHKGIQLGQDQATAVAEGLNHRVQLLLGPPGTGKTMTTSISMLIRALARRKVGDIILVSAHTHTAVNNILERINKLVAPFEAHAKRHGHTMPKITLAKVHSSEPEEPVGPGVKDLLADGCGSELTVLKKDSIVIVGGTTGSILKMSEHLDQYPGHHSAHATAFQTPLLVVDEASMMVFPHFLALASILSPEGAVMLAGDHRQLSPIYAHDWDREDRPPTVKYQPHLSAYEAVRRIHETTPQAPNAIISSALDYTWRLPPSVRHLTRAVYHEEGVDLKGPDVRVTHGPGADVGPWQPIWTAGEGVFLVVHDEHESRRSNEAEAAIIQQIIHSAKDTAKPGSVAIITPHRAQRSLLNTALEPYEHIVAMIDTVERLQGGEKPTIIVSGTASDPHAIIANVEFLLDKHRANVAFTRAQERLVIVCSQSLLAAIPAEHEHYENARLWKLLRHTCKRELARGFIGFHGFRVLGE